MQRTLTRGSLTTSLLLASVLLALPCTNAADDEGNERPAHLDRRTVNCPWVDLSRQPDRLRILEDARMLPGAGHVQPLVIQSPDDTELLRLMRDLRRPDLDPGHGQSRGVLVSGLSARAVAGQPAQASERRLTPHSARAPAAYHASSAVI